MSEHNPYTPPAAELNDDSAAPETASSGSPLSLQNLYRLYFRPDLYFADVRWLDRKWELPFVVWVLGMSGVIGRFDSRMTKAELKQTSLSWTAPLESWTIYWVAVLGLGVVSAIIIWWINGWWYKKRLQWSGARDPSPQDARRVYSFQEFVSASAIVAVAIIQTLLHGSYAEAWNADDVWPMFTLVFVFWSCWTGYKAGITAFALHIGKARFWLLILPLGFYIAAFGFVATMFAMFR